MRIHTPRMRHKLPIIAAFIVTILRVRRRSEPSGREKSQPVEADDGCHAHDFHCLGSAGHRLELVHGGARSPRYRGEGPERFLNPPKYLKKFPARDGWGNEIDFRTGDYRSKGGAQLYLLRSLGSDHIADAGAYTNRAVTKFEDDLIFTNGTFLQYPEGA